MTQQTGSQGPLDGDLLDGCEMRPDDVPTRDEDVPWVVLFAAVDLSDRHAVEAKARAWRALQARARLELDGDADADPPWRIGSGR